MSKQLNSKEKIIQLLNTKFNDENNDTNKISITRKDVQDLNISEKDASKTIQLLETSGFLTIKQKSVHNDFSMFWTVIINDSCTEYFDNKKESKTEKCRKFLKNFVHGLHY